MEIDWKIFGLVFLGFVTITLIATIYAPPTEIEVVKWINHTEVIYLDNSTSQDFGVELFCQDETGDEWTYGCVRQGWEIQGDETLGDLGEICYFSVCDNPEDNYNNDTLQIEDIFI